MTHKLESGTDPSMRLKWTEPLLDSNMIAVKSHPDDFIQEYHQPAHVKTVFKPSKPWDRDSWSTYFNLVTDPKNPKRILMYYRGNLSSGRTDYHKEYVCVVESLDGGLSFHYPSLKHVKFDKGGVKHKKKSKETLEGKKGTTEDKSDDIPPNNIVWKDDAVTHNFFALDTRYMANKDSLFYGIGGLFASSCRCCAKNVFLMESQDGFKWSKVKHIIPQGLSAKQGYGTLFDTLNSIAYNPLDQSYRIFFRYNFKRGVRCIQSTWSRDLHTWKEKCKALYYQGVKSGHYYIPSMMVYPESFYYIGFPSRQMKDSRAKQVLDMVFSRDGLHWSVLQSRWLKDHKEMDCPERFVPQILVSPSGTEFYLFINNAHKTTVELYKIRKHGLGSLCSKPGKECWFTTRKMYLESDSVGVNYQFVKKGGRLRVDILLDGKSVYHRDLKSRDELDAILKIPPKCVGHFIQLKFTMQDCRVFSFDLWTRRDKVKIDYVPEKQYINVGQQDIINGPVTRKVVSDSLPEVNRKKKVKPSEKAKKGGKSDIASAVIASGVIASGDGQDLKVINARLAKNPSNVIPYVYYDLKSSTGEGSNRQYVTGRDVKSISKVSYSNYHAPGGGGNPAYGRHFEFEVVYTDGKRELIELINNSSANCRVVFE